MVSGGKNFSNQAKDAYDYQFSDIETLEIIMQQILQHLKIFLFMKIIF